MSDVTKPISDTCLIRRINLAVVDNTFIVVPPPGEHGAPWEQFPLPPIPQSLIDWLAVFAEVFWLKHGRCVAALLLLDCSARCWGIGMPRQACTPDSAFWSLDSRSFAGLRSELCVAGSFQSRCVRALDEIPDAVPPVPGVHFVQSIEPDHQGILSFVNIAGELRAVEPQLLIVDEWALLLHQNASRLQIV